MSLLLKLQQIVARHAELQAQLSGGNLDSQKFVAASKEYADLGPLVESVNEWRKAEQELKDAEAMASDPDMKAIAEEEAAELKKRLPELERIVKRKLLPKDAADEKNAILEIRAGTGGDESRIGAAFGQLARALHHRPHGREHMSNEPPQRQQHTNCPSREPLPYA